MTYEEVTTLMTENMRIIGHLSSKVEFMIESDKGLSKQQIAVLVRLYLVGKIKLKDFSNMEVISTANLCGIFRKLEQNNLVIRSIDSVDHRDMWYEVTKSGKTIAEKYVNKFLTILEGLFSDLSEQDKDLLADTIKTVNGILKKMEVKNA